jgi:hypothetical protein
MYDLTLVARKPDIVYHCRRDGRGAIFCADSFHGAAVVTWRQSKLLDEAATVITAYSPGDSTKGTCLEGLDDAINASAFRANLVPIKSVHKLREGTMMAYGCNRIILITYLTNTPLPLLGRHSTALTLHITTTASLSTPNPTT